MDLPDLIASSGPARAPSLPRRMPPLLAVLVGVGPAARARRVLLLVLMLGMLNVYDLLLTLQARHVAGFVEANPIAAALLWSPAALAAFKALTVGFGLAVFIRFRRHRLTEAGCWLTSAVYVALAGRWWACLSVLS